MTWFGPEFTAWNELAAAIILFMLAHVLPARPFLRDRLTDALGEEGYLLVYSAVSLVLLGWLIVATGRAPHIQLWPFEPWQLWVPNVLMPLACLLLAFGFGAPNPLSFGGWAVERFEADRPGIAGITRHPLLLATLFWSGGHIVPNGDLAHVILFGSFAFFSLIGMPVTDARKQRQLGRRTWLWLAGRTSLVPFAALLSGRWQPSLHRFSVRRLGVAGLIYLAFLALHPWLIGVSPLPDLPDLPGLSGLSIPDIQMPHFR
ncbi:NnrU family protein [Rhodovastum atsumiense]|uniref:NnrU family protein n=1 Tax=Rhodovastum atsumiense TaxID=504468 RepID=A0A5M6IPA5_9PROT|nr:NnrU family protein [Rhodovastum atsumiense]KAA5610081.1 NnrU family protein [Rhodovastum atsumiense]CAH2601449.1 NnrU family protein [Rhodovastum atsumiense]